MHRHSFSLTLSLALSVTHTHSHAQSSFRGKSFVTRRDKKNSELMASWNQEVPVSVAMMSLPIRQLLTFYSQYTTRRHFLSGSKMNVLIQNVGSICIHLIYSTWTFRFLSAPNCFSCGMSNRKWTGSEMCHPFTRSQ